jgi:hypothetical protein
VPWCVSSPARCSAKKPIRRTREPAGDLALEGREIPARAPWLRDPRGGAPRREQRGRELAELGRREGDRFRRAASDPDGSIVDQELAIEVGEGSDGVDPLRRDLDEKDAQFGSTLAPDRALGFPVAESLARGVMASRF